ncbi:MAG: hypothetical protein JXQ27_01730 [Acidobacteria bacterium]|nr:hypothetical protein [Acidobacteriota bacterium]
MQIALYVLAGVLLLLVIQRVIIGAFRRHLMKRIQERFAGKGIRRLSLGANFFGQQSRGRGQIRGNGALVLTEDKLCFLLAAPRREYVIPLQQITGVSLPKSHLGKTILRPLLRVDFITVHGPDAIAWALADPDSWAREIEARRPKSAG